MRRRFGDVVLETLLLPRACFATCEICGEDARHQVVKDGANRFVCGSRQCQMAAAAVIRLTQVGPSTRGWGER